MAKQMTPKLMALIVVAMVASLCVAGCTVSIPGASQSHVQAYVNAIHDNVQNGLGPYQTLRSWKDTSESADTSRVTYTIYDSSSGYTTTYDERVKEFGTTDDASKFLEGMNSGYVSAVGSSLISKNVSNSAYTKAMGHDPTVVDMYLKATSSVPQGADYIAQTDEFVVYGSVASLSGLG